MKRQGNFRHTALLLGLTGAITLIAACQNLAGEPRIVGQAAAQSTSSSLDVTNADPTLSALMTQGGDVWLQNCAECHGNLGEGTSRGAPLPDLTNVSDDQTLATIVNGAPDTGHGAMTGFGDRLTADQIAAVLTYTKMISQAIVLGMVQAPVTTPEAGGVQVADAGTVEPGATAEPDVLGSVSGQVTNGTAGSTIPSDLVVTLHIIQSQISEQTFDTPVSADGTYSISGVPFNTNYQYVVTAPYGDIMFVSDIVSGDPASPSINLPVTIYEGGAPDSAIEINTLSAQVFVQDGVMQVVQVVNFANNSDKAYLNLSSDSATSVHLRVPQGATFVDTSSSTTASHTITSSDGTLISDTRPLLPGHTLLMHASFTLPYTSSVSVDQMMDYPINGAVNVALATGGLSLSGEGFPPTGDVTSGGVTMNAYGGQLIRDAGTDLRYDVSGTPVVTAATTSTTTSTDASQPSPIAYVLIGAGVSALLIAGILAIRDRLAAPKTSSKQSIADLMEQIADLDGQHQAGKIAKVEYERKRAALKQQLSQLMKSQG